MMSDEIPASEGVQISCDDGLLSMLRRLSTLELDEVEDVME